MWVTVVLAALCVLCGGVFAMGQAVVARHRAGGAADLAALAAADHWAAGPSVACAAADRVAAAQGARLLHCAVRGAVSHVTAGASVGPFSTHARSRAGPAGPLR